MSKVVRRMRFPLVKLSATWTIPFAFLLLISIATIPCYAAWSGTDEEFVEMVQDNNWDYFYNNQGTYGAHSGNTNPFFRGHGAYNSVLSFDSVNTCAGDGFGIAALVVAAYRGWISHDEAYGRILSLLQLYDTSLAQDGNGFYNHFYNFDTAAPTAEYSSIDSSWLACGALMAAEYFKGTELDEVANRVYQDLDYSAVSPYTGYHEYMILNILGAGSPTHAWAPATSRAAWNASMVPGYWGPLFWYQWPQHFVDFRHHTDDGGYNHFMEARTAMLTQRQQCIDLKNAEPTKYEEFGTNGWGLTAAGGSLGYIELRPFSGWCTANSNYGVNDGSCGTDYHVTSVEAACDSGTLVPICLPACISHVPYEAREAMKHIYNTYPYNYSYNSFVNTFNEHWAWSGGSYTSVINASMDYGANVLAIENFRSGMPWKYFMRHPNVQDGLANCGIVRTNWIPYHDDWNDGSDLNAWDGGTSLTNSDGSNPTVTYTAIASNNASVNGYVRKITANGAGDITRFTFSNNDTRRDQSANDMLSFWLRAEHGTEHFNVGLRDGEGHEVTVSVTSYIEGGAVPTNWTRVRIPMKPFLVSDSANYDVRATYLADVSFHMNTTGSIYIDDLAFLLDDIAPAPPTFGAACIDGRVYTRWGTATEEDVVGYHLWRRPDTVSGFDRLNTDLISFKYSEIDARVESDWGEDYFYSIQAIDRNGNAGSFSGAEYEQRVWIGRHLDLDHGDGIDPNTLGGNNGTWGGSWHDNTYALETAWHGDTNWVRVIEGDAYNGGFIGLNNGNLGKYDAVAFWLKQNWGANDFELGLKSADGAEDKVPITDYAAVTDSWTYVVIPFVDFKSQNVLFTNMENMSFTFITPGSIYVDEPRFVRLDQESALLFVGEGEECGGHIGGDTNDFKWNASESFTLGNSWATNADDEVWWNVTLPSIPNEAYVDVRYACGMLTGRTLDVYINSSNMVSFEALASGGWGDESWHFREDTIRLGKLPGTTFLLKLVAPDVDSAVNLDRVILRSGSHWFREAEDYDTQAGSSGPDYKPGAYGGEVLGNSWSQTNTSYAEYTNIVFDASMTNAVVRARYGQNWSDGRLLRVYLDGTNMGRLAFAYTGGWLDHYCHGDIAELPLGNIAAGTHKIRLEAESDDEPINLDWLQIDNHFAAVKEHDTDEDGIPDSQEGLYGTQTGYSDSDGDGINDLDEISRYGGYVTSPTDSDTDDDTMSDGDEDFAGTDPTSDSSVFEFTDFAAQPVGGAVQLIWPSVSGKSYDVLYRDGGFSVDGTFEPITDPENISVISDTASYTDDGTGTTPPPDDPAAAQRTYRIRVFGP